MLAGRKHSCADGHVSRHDARTSGRVQTAGKVCLSSWYHSHEFPKWSKKFSSALVEASTSMHLRPSPESGGMGVERESEGARERGRDGDRESVVEHAADGEREHFETISIKSPQPSRGVGYRRGR